MGDGGAFALQQTKELEETIRHQRDALEKIARAPLSEVSKRYIDVANVGLHWQPVYCLESELP